MSQDQTLHKKGREKPKPRQKDKPQQTTPQKAASPELAIQKLHKEKISKPTPNPTGHKRRLAKSEDFKSFTPKQLMLFTMTPLKEKRHPAYTNRDTHTAYHSHNE
ncbi:hypothetical protein ACUXA5_000985 [Corynebacterium hesseae]